MTNARSVWRHRRWAFWLMLMLVVVIGIGFIAVAARAAEQDIRAELLDQACRMAAAIDPHLVSALSGTPADLTAPEYVRLKEQLTQTRQAFPDARFLYLMGQHPDGAVFIFVDSETPGSEDESSPGDIYWEATDDILDAFSSQRARTYPPFDDRWGSWVSALVPLVDPATDDIQAVFGIDVSTQDWRGIVARRLVKPVGFAVMLTVGAVAGVALLYRRARLPVAQRERRVARYAEALVIGTIGLTLTSMLAYEAVVREDRSRREGLARLAEAKTYSVSETLHGIGSPGLIGLASLFASSRTVEPQEFHSYIGHLSASPTVQAWGWVLSVRAEDLTSTEESIRREGPADYAVWELDHQGVRRPVSAREVYYPIRYTRLRSHAGKPR